MQSKESLSSSRTKFNLLFDTSSSKTYDNNHQFDIIEHNLLEQDISQLVETEGWELRLKTQQKGSRSPKKEINKTQEQSILGLKASQDRLEDLLNEYKNSRKVMKDWKQQLQSERVSLSKALSDQRAYQSEFKKREQLIDYMKCQLSKIEVSIIAQGLTGDDIEQYRSLKTSTKRNHKFPDGQMRNLIQIFIEAHQNHAQEEDNSTKSFKMYEQVCIVLKSVSARMKELEDSIRTLALALKKLQFEGGTLINKLQQPRLFKYFLKLDLPLSIATFPVDEVQRKTIIRIATLEHEMESAGENTSRIVLANQIQKEQQNFMKEYQRRPSRLASCGKIYKAVLGIQSEVQVKAGVRENIPEHLLHGINRVQRALSGVDDKQQSHSQSGRLFEDKLVEDNVQSHPNTSRLSRITSSKTLISQRRILSSKQTVRFKETAKELYYS